MYLYEGNDDGCNKNYDNVSVTTFPLTIDLFDHQIFLITYINLFLVLVKYGLFDQDYY